MAGSMEHRYSWELYFTEFDSPLCDPIARPGPIKPQSHPVELETETKGLVLLPDPQYSI